MFEFKWHFKSFPPFKCIGDLCWSCRKIGEGHYMVMIYMHIVVLKSSILHAKFRWNRSTSSFWRDFTIYGHGGHLGHVTWIIYIHIDNTILHIKYGFEWPSGFRGEDVLNIMEIYMYIEPGWGHMSPWGPFFSESLIFSHTAHFLQDIPFKWHFKSFPHSCIGDLCWPCRKIGQGHHRVMIYVYIAVL